MAFGMRQVVHGYAEGYYGRLLSWQERHLLLETMAGLGQDTYYYAPKEDALHRLHWRTPYDATWREQFRRFCETAKRLGISVVAGVAPGLDFDYNHLSGGADLQVLLNKFRQLREDGADQLSLLMDDIDEDFHTRNAGISSEGLAHARLSNTLAEALGDKLWITPRIYANELAGSATDYLPDFLSTLEAEHIVLYCGSDIVARQANADDIRQLVPGCDHELVLWDNLYANDYCPQRLFVGPWLGRSDTASCLLNPTGMLHTDCLLMDVMASSRLPGADPVQAWQAALLRHGVPAEFEAIARFVYHPVFNGETFTPPEPATAETHAAIEECLWRWKTPLSREWYPFLFGLKLDLLMEKGSMSELRIRKTQSVPLAMRLGIGAVKKSV
ncbi:beta-N-acetylglucosaminidase domain-containing protein [Granulosicoccus antarcticus]|uniref:O-GlcNAcase NagJ n=1 Tax=Granulosicoccus antarcticus IMCC3135 TaxID=1192854 RepID=A0A2Z2NSP6_9GAMM|nr:beta-N-acetylglucosaminidase domain-containing protein [Granulosicoccus antarcticus]ASJ70194.1 O-GlcNAcase NagJ [Granulosicoccus antarcticus IMCC3135]